MNLNEQALFHPSQVLPVLDVDWYSISQALCSTRPGESHPQQTYSPTMRQPASRRKPQKFPEKLMDILCWCESAYSGTTEQSPIAWLHHGRCFRIVDPARFTESVLPIFFKGSKYKSFTRRLYRWGFRQITTGPDKDSFFHESFQRDHSHLCLNMRCHYSEKEQRGHRMKRKASGPSDKEKETKNKLDTEPKHAALHDNSCMFPNSSTNMVTNDTFKHQGEILGHTPSEDIFNLSEFHAKGEHGDLLERTISMLAH